MVCVCEAAHIYITSISIFWSEYVDEYAVCDDAADKECQCIAVMNV